MARPIRLIEEYLRAVLIGAGHEAHALRREHPDWNPGDDFGLVATVFELAAFARFGEQLDPAALRAFLNESLDDAARARPPVRPLTVQRVIEDVYELPDDNPLGDRDRDERQAAIWFALPRLVPADTPQDAVDRLMANAAELLDVHAEFGAFVDDPCRSWPDYVCRSGLADWPTETR